MVPSIPGEIQGSVEDVKTSSHLMGKGSICSRTQGSQTVFSAGKSFCKLGRGESARAAVSSEKLPVCVEQAGAAFSRQEALEFQTS